ncbi:MAG: hypothetical protein FWH18_06525 [Marinilabiliaceae bacterium]|nr:hypothetical protein [Marinilabiliaceae bacterium]
MENRENFYILLELDPSIIDEITVNKAIEAKKQQWNRIVDTPRIGIEAKKNLDNLSQIKRILQNPQTRKIEAEAAKRILQERKNQIIEKIKIAGTLVVKDGEINMNALMALTKKFQLPENEILEILKVKRKNEKEESHSTNNCLPILEESLIKDIRAKLKTVGKKNLFDFLSLSSATSCAELRNKAAKIYKEASENSNKTAINTATESLAGTCQNCFENEIMKTRYINSMHFENFDEIKDLIDFTISAGTFSLEVYENLLKLCAKEQIPKQIAEQFILEYYIKKCRHYISKNNLEEAKKMAKDAILVWTTNPEIEKLNIELNKEESFENAIRVLITKKNFFAAQRKTKELKIFDSANKNLVEFETKCNEEINKAKNYYQQASDETDNEKKLNLFGKTIEVCADYPEAANAISQMRIIKGINSSVTPPPPIVVDYKVIVKKLFTKSASVEICCKNPNVILPQIIVIAKQNSFPISKTDGKCILTIQRQNPGTHKLPFEEVEGKEIRLFFANTNDNNKFRLMKN